MPARRIAHSYFSSLHQIGYDLNYPCTSTTAETSKKTMNSRKRIATTPPPSAQSRTKAARQDIDQKTAILPRDLEKDDFIVPRAQHRAAKAEKHQYGQLLGAAEKVSLETQIPPGLTGMLVTCKCDCNLRL